MASALGALRSPGLAAVAILLISLVYIILLVPAPGISLPWMAVDDGLFLRWSLSIQRGDWLGPWDYLTTSKGPLHSLLVAWTAGLGIGPFAYKRLFLLVGSLIFVHCVIRPTRPWLRVALLLALLADPFQYGALGLRNLREGTYLPIQMITLGLGSLSLDRIRRQPLRPVPILLPALAMAFAFGLLLITREGRVIVGLELLFWLLLAALLLFRALRINRLSLRRVLPFVLASVLILLLPLLPVSILRSVQASHYGFPLSNSLEEGGYGQFFQKLSNLREKGDQSYIPRVAVKKRAISLAVQELPDRPGGLKSILAGIDWKEAGYGCSEFPDTCGNMASGWLMWEVRHSLANQLGSSPSEDGFQALIAQAQGEIDSLCRSSERLECLPLSSGYFIKPSRWGFADMPAAVRQEMSRVLAKVFLPDPFPFGRPDLNRNTFSSPLNRADLEGLGLRDIPASDRFFWQRIFVATSLLGALLRCSLLALALVSLLLFLRQGLGSARPDPVAIWLLGCVLAHSAIYILIGLVSFPGAPYTILTAPIAIGLYARLIDFNFCLRSQNISQQTCERTL